jgi:pSer/pThr/pTyr-binding forkhead associated (FHA) protein
MAFALRVASGQGRRRRFRFEREEISIGRSAQSDLILNDAGVSRSHARIQRQGADWVLLDCGSAGGTQLNGAALLSPARLRKGDLIRVGEAVFRFEPAGQRARVPLRSGVAAVAGLVLVAAGSAAFLHGRGHRHEPALDPAAALAWTPDAPGAAVHGADPAAHSQEGAGRAAEPAATANLETGPVPVPDPARAAYERGRRKLDERRIAPRNLYDAWSAFTESRRLLEGASPEPPLRAELAQLIHDAEEDLGRDCSRLLFAAARFDKYGEGEQAQQAYRDVLLRFPGDEPSGCRKTAQARLSAAKESE